MTQPIFKLNWQNADAQAAQRIIELEQHLDHRKKSLKVICILTNNSTQNLQEVYGDQVLLLTE